MRNDFESQTMVTVSAAEFQKNFGQYRERAQREPVTVTSYGRDSVVVVSAEEYQRLKSIDQKAFAIWDADQDDLDAILNSEPHPDTALYDHELKP